MSLRLRAALIALGLGALACSGEAPTSADPTVTTDPAFAKTNPAVRCTWYYSSSIELYRTDLSWAAISGIWSYQFNDDIHTSNKFTLDKSARNYSAPAFNEVWPADTVKLFKKNGTVAKTQACTEVPAP